MGGRAIFFVNVPIGIVACVLAGRRLPQMRDADPPRLDLVGVALSTAGLFLLALQRLFTGDTVVPSEADPDETGEDPGPVRADGGTASAIRPREATRMQDLRGHELASIVPLLVLALILGLLPRVLLDVLEPAAMAVVGLVGR